MEKNDLASPVSSPPATLVVVGAQFIEVLGQRLGTVDELLALLAAHQIKRICLKTVRGGDEERGKSFYEVIGAIIYSTQRCDIEIEKVDEVAIPPSMFTPP